MYSSRENGTFRVPAGGSSGLLTASSSSTCPSGIVVDHHPQRLAARPSPAAHAGSRSSRRQCSSSAMSVTPSNLVTPIRRQNSRIASGV